MKGLPSESRDSTTKRVSVQTLHFFRVQLGQVGPPEMGRGSEAFISRVLYCIMETRKTLEMTALLRKYVK